MMPLKIGFVGLKCYDLLADVPRPRYFGGAERQQVQLARGLAARGHAVSFVTLDHGQADATMLGEVRVFKAYAAADGVPVVRFLHPRWTGLVGAMRRADADVFYQMGADSETGQIAAWCRWRGKRFVFSLASDADVDPALPLLHTARQRVLYRAGLRRADAVVAQTNAQREQLTRVFSRDAVVIRNCTADPGVDIATRNRRSAGVRPRLLWVGRFVPVKRLELLLDLAAARPDWDFHVVGAGDRSQAYVHALEGRARALLNVTLHQGITDAALGDEYRRADALLCTSSVEGVPTTFLEAWARGVPVVSTVDPDEAIAAHGLGASTRAEGLAAAVAALLAEDPAVLARRCRSHFIATHTIDAFVSHHEQAFLAVTAYLRGAAEAAEEPRAPSISRR